MVTALIGGLVAALLMLAVEAIYLFVHLLEENERLREQLAKSGDRMERVPDEIRERLDTRA